MVVPAMNLSSLASKLRPFSPSFHHSFMASLRLHSHPQQHPQLSPVPLSLTYIHPAHALPHFHSKSTHIAAVAGRADICVERPASSVASSTLPSASAPLSLVVVSFYKFAHLPDFEAKRQPLKDLCEELRVSGGIILAPEGINGSICGTRDAVEKVLENIQSDTRLSNLRRIESPATDEQDALHHGHTEKSPLGAGDDAPFRWGHVRVKLKNEIVTLGLPDVSPAKQVGKYVSPKDWNALIQEEDTMVVDVRNAYEIRIGKFKGAVNPETDSFREFPTWIEDSILKQMNNPESEKSNSEPPAKLPQKIAMYCTGGIRCEKATSLLLSKGFREVYHLQGGILKYLEEVPEKESLWEGECFVFDKRVSVEHGLKPGTYKLCYACKKPVSNEDMLSLDWEEGVSCPYCAHVKSEKEKERARARQRQVEMWGVVGGPHKGKRPSKQRRNGQEGSGPKLSTSI